MYYCGSYVFTESTPYHTKRKDITLNGTNVFLFHKLEHSACYVKEKQGALFVCNF
jgi:hypothetical protein